MRVIPGEIVRGARGETHEQVPTEISSVITRKNPQRFAVKSLKQFLEKFKKKFIKEFVEKFQKKLLMEEITV